ncbi:hypothetical protein ACEWY4_015228 [Coilia grayii]|uniref:Ig-like domain-containing protein n=1 Tax=Coilia grayii TaxID=363190 RepID=A0ABD1JND9_9TELE
MIPLFCLIFLGLSSTHGKDEFTYQQHIGCTFNRHGHVGRFWRYGFNTKDIMHVDLENEAVVSTSDDGNFMADERKSKLYFKRKEARLNMICSAVQTVFWQSNNSLSRAAKPTVRVSMEVQEGQEYLACSVQGFYPIAISVHWVYRGKIVHFGNTKTGVLPHKDGTFQMTSYLPLGNKTLQDIVCETEHISIEGKLRATFEDESSNLGYIVGIALVSFLLSCLAPLGITALILFMRKRGPQSSVNESLDQSSDGDIAATVTLMDLTGENVQAEPNPEV